MGIGTGIAGRQMRKERNASKGGRMRAGSEIIKDAAQKVQSKLLTEVGGEMKPVFVFGVHAPDDPNVERYVI